MKPPPYWSENSVNPIWSARTFLVNTRSHASALVAHAPARSTARACSKNSEPISATTAVVHLNKRPMPSPNAFPTAFSRAVNAIAIRNGNAARLLDLNQGKDLAADAS